uniref:Complex III subunit 9 n=1 Tax=Rhizophora mucronata TaxID=61149 RepID=A0A2P2JUV2_RHIMU
MDYTSRRAQKGPLELIYRLIMRRTSVYATFVVAGAFAGERVVDYGVHKLWEYNNVGVRGVLNFYIGILSFLACLK